MPAEGPERDEYSPCRDEPTPSRRRLLGALSTGVLAGGAGCSSTETSPERSAATSTRADEASTETANDPTSATSETTEAASPYFETRYLDRSPSSSFAPTAGFGSVEWLAEAANPPVVTVTNVRKDGEGSLRWALNQRGARIVVFEVGGVIDLQGENIVVESGNVYVAGQTAPSPGVTVIRGAVDVADSNVLVQHLRVRPGDQLGDGPVDDTPDGRAVDALSVDSGTPNVVFDHCSVSWGSDENMSAGGGATNRDITFSNNLIAECLSRSPLHEEEEHSKGTLINDHARRTSVVGNTYVHNTDRHPRIKGDASCAVVNNYTYNFEEAIEMGGGPQKLAVGSIVGNYFRGGPATEEGPMIKAEGYGAKAYVVYNETVNPGMQRANPQLELLREPPLWPEELSYIQTSRVPEHNLATAGARPADRSPHDERIVEHARNGTGRIIDSQSEVGGYPDLATTRRALSPPAAGDGLAAWLYEHTKAVEIADAAPP